MNANQRVGGEPSFRAIHRACAVLELLSDAGQALTAAEISARGGLAPATTHRLLRALTARGYLHQDRSRRFELGPVVLRLGTVASRAVPSWASPVLTTVVRESGESAYLACLQDDHVSCLAQAQSARSMRSCTEVGAQTLPHCTAAGKALLAQLPRQDRVATLARTGTPSYTANTINDPDTLLAELDAAYGVGYTVAEEEHERSESSIAVPVPGTPFVSALSVSGPSTRLGLPARSRIVEVLWKAADELGDLGNGIARTPVTPNVNE